MDLPVGYQLRAPSADELEAVADVVIADELYRTGQVTLGADFHADGCADAGPRYTR